MATINWRSWMQGVILRKTNLLHSTICSLLSTPRRHVPALFILCIKSLKITLWGMSGVNTERNTLRRLSVSTVQDCHHHCHQDWITWGELFPKTVTAVGGATQWPFQGLKKKKKKNTSITNDWHAKPCTFSVISLLAPLALCYILQHYWAQQSLVGKWALSNSQDESVTGLNQTPSFPSC